MFCGCVCQVCVWVCVYLLVLFVASSMLLGNALLDGRQGVRREALKALWSHWKHTASHLLILILLLTGPVYQLQTHRGDGLARETPTPIFKCPKLADKLND